MSSEEKFDKQREKLLVTISNRLESINLNEVEKMSLHQVISTLGDYTYLNRLEMKGILSHQVIDSLTLDYSIAEKIIEFDNCIR